MQQRSQDSGLASTYNSNLTNLVNYVKKNAPNAKLIWHMTWAYQGNSNHAGFSNYSNNQTTMYNGIVNAVKTPYARTTSAHTNPANELDHYKLLTVDYTHNAYWHSTKEGNYSTLYKPSSSEATYREFYGSNKRFTASTIPVGSVIILTSGYKYRPEAWVSNKIQTSREGATTVAHTAVADEWWKNKDGTSFLYRAFNVSLSSGAQIASGLDIDNNILKIYVPKTDAVVTKTPEELYSYITNLPDPIPNNHRVTWTNVSDIPSISGKKFIVVSDPSTTGNKYYAWDPITPSLFETWNAASVSVNSTSGTSRVYDAGENWGIKFTNDATFDYKQAGYTDSNVPGNKMKNITKGSWDLTLQKIGGKNGGDLAWSNVETAYDLAYYALTYIWREVPTTDANKLSDGDRYNIRVPEREIIRLYRTSNSGYYTFFSDNNTAYSGNRLYNTFPTIANPTAVPQYADFMPVDGLGFETGGKNTDTGTNYANNGSIDKLATDNFHYVMHAYGSFVYYEDQELFFEFIGDDDVYFFINNTLVLDIGGSHSPLGGTVNLKDVTLADGTKLVDEQIYSFDMYYAERHTTGSNMKFSTNIKIVDTDTFTTKGQYIEISGDDDMVNKATGMGGEILDNGLVKVGDTIAYSFNVVNSHDVSATDLIFEDETLGTYISKNIISLTNEERTNIVTDITDIEVYYHTSEKVGESFVIDNTKPVVKTVDQIKAMIEEVNAANEIDPGNSLPEGSYRVTMTSEQDLMDLLGLGVPSNCQIVIYGFKRLFVEGDQNKTITNELKMTCSYLPWASGDTELNIRTLTGTASRILKVAPLSGTPVANKYKCVFDQGKPLAVSISDLATTATGVTLNGIVGFTKIANYNGEFLKEAPADMTAVWETESGTFTGGKNAFVYEQRSMSPQLEKLYAVISLSGCQITDAQGKMRNYPYMVVECVIAPANVMYYETDFDREIYDLSKSDSMMITFSDIDQIVWESPSNITSPTKAGGVLKGTISGTDPHIQMSTASCTLNHIIKPTDVVKVRVRSQVGSGNGMQVFFMTDENSGPVGGVQTKDVSYTPNGDWQIVTMQIEPRVIGRKVIGLRLDPIFNYTANGTFEYDWVYIGPDVDVNTPLLVDFDENDTTAWNPTGNHATATKENGVLKGTMSGTDPFVRMTPESSKLSHIIRENDVVKVRIKSNASLNENNGMQVFFLTDTNKDPAAGVSTKIADYTPNNEWQTITLQIEPNLIDKQIIGLRIDPVGTNTVEFSGDFEIDWVYIGSEEEFNSGDVFSYTTKGATEENMNWTHVGSTDTVKQTGMTLSELPIYGNDPAYNDDLLYSNDSSMFVNGAGVPLIECERDEDGKPIYNEGGSVTYTGINYDCAYTEASFDFVGTGFDIISHTGVQQGALRVIVLDENGKFERNLTVINRNDAKLELHQIPVLKVDDLTYGKHTVKIFVNAAYDFSSKEDGSPDGNADIFGGALDLGGQFYFDAVRIYNPIDVTASDADSVLANAFYQGHAEAEPTYTEIRNMLITAENFNAGGQLDGVAFLGAIGNEKKTALENYKAVGPNNEVYLEKNKAIAFKLEVTGEIPTKISIGAKSVGTTPAALLTVIATKAPSALPTGTATTIATSTEMYYSLNISEWLIEGDKSYAYVTVANTGDGLLSLTNIKLSHAAEPAAIAKSIRFVFDAAMREALGMQAEHTYTYINNGESHTVGCAGCDFSETVDHTYVDGICVCGAVEIVEPSAVFVEGLKPIMAITVGADMSVAYTIPNELISQYDKFYLEVEKEYADKDSVKITYNLEDLQAVPNFDTPVLYNALFKGINAKEMGDRITATLYGIGEDGTIYYGPTVADSIKDYLMRGLDLTTTTDAKKTMYVDMLNYGAVAQAYMGYNAQNPVNKDLAERHLAYATTTLPEANDLSDTNGNGYEISANVQLLSRVTLTMTAILPEANVENMKYVISDALTDEVITELPVTIKNNIVCTGSFDNVGAKQMRRLLKITLFDGDIAISRSITWSIESYVAQTRTTTDLAKIDLVNALLTYGDSVAAYMAE